MGADSDPDVDEAGSGDEEVDVQEKESEAEDGGATDGGEGDEERQGSAKPDAEDGKTGAASVTFEETSKPGSPAPVYSMDPTPGVDQGEALLTAAVPRLDDLVVKCLAENYDIYPALDRIPPEYLDNVVALLDPSQIEFSVAAKYITTEKFWKRLSQERWPICQIQEHGLSWKRLYIERHTQSLLEAYYPSKGRNNFVRLNNELSAAKPFVHKIKVQQLLSHLDLSEILSSFPNLSTLHLRYGARKLGMDYDKSLFGMQLKDAMNLSKLLVKAPYLSSLMLPENLLNDEAVHFITNGLAYNETITNLDLSHNKVGDAGAKRLSKVLETHGVLQQLDLSDNNVHTEGAQYLARAFQRNSVITTFSIKLNPIGDRGGRDLFTHLKENNCLEELNVSSCGLGQESGAALLELLETTTSITHLDISCNELGLQQGDLKKAIVRAKKVVSVEFRRCGVEDEEASEIKAVLAQRWADLKQSRRKAFQKGWDEAL